MHKDTPSAFNTANDALDFAIQGEQESHDFYMGLAAKVTQPGIKKVFEGFAREEAGHKARLEKVKEGNLLVSAEKKVLDLKVSDYLVDVTPSPDMDYQEALIVAMKKEKAAYKLYLALSEAVDDENVSNTFLGLANEEAKHKLRFEIIYDDQVLTEN
jgi:rubrerythrin